MSNTVQTVLDKLSPLFKTTDEVLTEWSVGKSEGNLQFPVLLGMIAVKMNWDEKMLRENDPMVRYYVRNNPEWHVTRGAHGGIMRATDKQNKVAAKQAKDAIKAQLVAAIDAKTSSNVISDVVSTVDESDDDSDAQ
jgi:hypothetical protein